jgi:DNA ligase-1
LAKNIKILGLAKAVKNPQPKVGVPVEPMLAQRLKSPKEMVKKMGRVSVEPKLDGLRLSIHYKRGSKTIKAYTRNMNETSWMFPELEEIGEELSADEVILDSEAVGLDENTKKMANFQTTMTRRRKHNIGKAATQTAIKFYVFDILYKDGRSLMDRPYLKRREDLEKTIKKQKNLKLVDYRITEDPQEIESIYEQKIKEGLEGVMVKKVDASYVPGRTGYRWVKMKQAEKAYGKLADTVDCVVMGYSAGRGKRVSFGMGQFLVGVLDGVRIKTVTKIGTGLTDEQFRQLKKRLASIRVNKKPKEYDAHKNYTPDFWVEPKVVVEIAADDITKSPTHTSGLALRFPRLVRFRDDKAVEQATTKGEVEKLFKLQ